MGHQFIVLAHGESPYLASCLDSLLAQTVGSSILITTSTPCAHVERIAASYKIAVHVNPSSGGIAADWNFGLANASEDFVTLAHQDDIYYPEFGEVTRSLFQMRSPASISFTDYEEIDATGKKLKAGRVIIIKRLLRDLALASGNSADKRWRRQLLLAFGDPILCPSVTLNMALIPSFRFSEEFEINLDWDAWWRLHVIDNPFVLSRRRLMAHRIHLRAETSVGKSDGRRKKEDRAMFQRIWPKPIASALATFYKIGY